MPNFDDGWAQNFQRNVQAMLYLLNWKCVTREEIRMNLPRLGMILQTEPHELPQVPGAPVQYPDEESFPMADLHDVPEEVLAFIEENQIPDFVLAQLNGEAFADVDSLARALTTLAASMITEDDGKDES